MQLRTCSNPFRFHRYSHHRAKPRSGSRLSSIRHHRRRSVFANCTRRHRVRPVARPPDDTQCNLFSNNTLSKPTLYIDNLYNSLPSFLLFWHVKISSLKTYNGIDVIDNCHPLVRILWPATPSLSSAVVTSKSESLSKLSLLGDTTDGECVGTDTQRNRRQD